MLMDISISVKRYTPEKDEDPKWIGYTVPIGDRTTVLESLMYIYEHLDPTLAFRFGCRYDTCGLCAVEANGKPRMACLTKAKEGMKIGPLARLPLVRDLVIDRTAFFNELHELKLFIPDQKNLSEHPPLNEPEMRRRLLLCVECLACNATCPEYKFKTNSFPGPYALVKLAQMHLDTRNVIDRQAQAKNLGIDKCAQCTQCYCIHGINIRRDVIKVLSA
jgi:succinate dehydrogenase/fumarate reductase iron-sulfur protein